MLIVTFISMLFKLFHFWIVIGEGFDSVFPNLLYLSVSMIELITFFLLLKLIKNSTARICVAFTANLTLGALITANYLYIRVFRIPLSFSLLQTTLYLGNSYPVYPNSYKKLCWLLARRYDHCSSST